MEGNDECESDGQQRSVDDERRRNLLKLTGVGVGLAGVAGATGAGALGGGDDDSADDDGEDSNGDDDGEKDDGNGDDDHFIADLVDPTFGYPLAADETDDLSLEHVVEVTQEEGSGAHPDFPTEDFGGEGMVGTPGGATGTPTGTPSTPTETATSTDDTQGESGEIPIETFFDPVGLHVEPDDLVHFAAVAGLHTITAFHEKFSEPQFEMPTRVPEGVPGFTSPPLVPTESWVYQFTEPGVYDYFCFPHLGLGMVGRIVVFDPEMHDLDDEAFAEPETDGLLPNAERVLTAPELDPASIVENGTVAWADLTLDGAATDTGTETDTETGTETDTETETETDT